MKFKKGESVRFLESHQTFGIKEGDIGIVTCTLDHAGSKLFGVRLNKPDEDRGSR